MKNLNKEKNFGEIFWAVGVKEPPPAKIHKVQQVEQLPLLLRISCVNILYPHDLLKTRILSIYWITEFNVSNFISRKGVIFDSRTTQISFNSHFSFFSYVLNIELIQKSKNKFNIIFY